MVVQVKQIESTNNVKIYAEANGDASNPALILVHGWCSSCETFDSIFEHEELLKSTYLIRYDLRGHGRSQGAGPGSIKPKNIYDDFHAVCKAFDLSRKPTLVGWSLGASIAADILAEDADALTSIVWLAPLPWLGAIQAKIGLPDLHTLVPGLMAQDDVAYSNSTSELFVDTLSANALDHDGKLRLLGAMALVTPAIRGAWVSRKQDTDALFEAIKEKKVKVLHVHGKQDLQIDGAALQEEMKDTFGEGVVTSVLLDGAGHVVHIDARDEVVKQILSFVQ